MLLAVPFLILASWLSSLDSQPEPPRPQPRPTVYVVRHVHGYATPMVRRTIFLRYEPARMQTFLQSR